MFFQLCIKGPTISFKGEPKQSKTFYSNHAPINLMWNRIGCSQLCASITYVLQHGGLLRKSLFTSTYVSIADLMDCAAEDY
jgi:hypothetical protein